jgi:hypothetical protein
MTLFAEPLLESGRVVIKDSSICGIEEIANISLGEATRLRNLLDACILYLENQNGNG